MKHQGILKALIVSTFVVAVPHARANLSLLSTKEATLEQQKVSKLAASRAEDDLREGRVERVTRQGLEVLVRAALLVLREDGHASYATRKEREWNTSFSLYSSNGLGALDLGDHAPLSQWVAGFYNGLESRVDRKWLKLFNLYDLKIFNYGIPVAVRPGGDRRTGKAWGEKEYGLHFVPVSAASIYWISNGACSLTVPPPFSLGCGVAALLPRYGMEYLVAPGLSRAIYRQFND
jgi:hypothetical protein